MNWKKNEKKEKKLKGKKKLKKRKTKFNHIIKYPPQKLNRIQKFYNSFKKQILLNKLIYLNFY